jgi:sarcosine oxidase subunit alpha
MAPRRLLPTDLAPDSPLARRLAALPAAARVTVEHDRAAVPAVTGEPLAVALLAARRLTLARSVKYHRPRGAMCLRGDCDGCLVRLDGVPNVMACQTPVRAGMVVQSQNAFPTAGIDVFRVTDWFFPEHLDHHHLLVQFGGALNRTMQAIARRMAGLGTLPDAVATFPRAESVSVDALVVGGGSSGVACANALARGGASVLLVDEREGPGGMRRDDPTDDGAYLACEPGVTARYGAGAVATYDSGTLVIAADGGGVSVRASARVFATGNRESVGTFPQNDVPGVFTARAFALALCHGVLAGERVVVVGDGPFARAVVASLGAKVTHAPAAAVVEAAGGRAVRAVTLREGGRERTVKCDALVVDGEGSAAYELAGQAGARVLWSDGRRCFVPESDAGGATAHQGVYVTGSLRLGELAHAARATDGERVAARVLRDLRGEGR